MTKWEYLVEWIPMPADFVNEGEWAVELQRALDDRGELGWELVRVMGHNGIFKRPIQHCEPIVVSGFTVEDFEALAKQVNATLADHEEAKHDNPRD